MILAFALMMLASSPPAPVADRAGNRVVPFAAGRGGTQIREDSEEGPGTLHCTADRRWCARLMLGEGESQWRLQVFEGMPADPAVAEIARSVDLAMDYDNARFTLRGEAVATNDGALLIEVERYSFTGYSGGGQRDGPAGGAPRAAAIRQRCCRCRSGRPRTFAPASTRTTGVPVATPAPIAMNSTAGSRSIPRPRAGRRGSR